MITKYEVYYFLNRPPRTLGKGLLKMGVIASYLAILTFVIQKIYYLF